MAKEEKGFFDSLIEDLQKNMDCQLAIELSKDKDGKPDPYKAAGMAAGMGHSSFSDTMMLGAMLGAQGAFDDDDSDSVLSDDIQPDFPPFYPIDDSDETVIEKTIETQDEETDTHEECCPKFTKEEIIEREKKRKRSRRMFKGIIALCLVAFFGVKISQHVRYFRAVSLYDGGSYSEAKEAFERIKEADVMDTKEYISLCEAQMYFSDKNIGAAHFNTFQLTFRYMSKKQKEAFSEFKEKVNKEHMENLGKQSEKRRKEYLEKIAKGVPYVGMIESDIGKTSLGSPSAPVRHSYEIIGGERYTVNIYDFKRGGKVVFTAQCVNRKIVRVSDFRNYAFDENNKPYYPENSSGSSKDDDPYNAKDYSNEEDFYEDNYDYFLDFYEAEEYYREHS